MSSLSSPIQTLKLLSVPSSQDEKATRFPLALVLTKNAFDGKVISPELSSQSPAPAPAPDSGPAYFPWKLSPGQPCPSLFSLQTLVVGSTLELNMTVTVWNEGEDSYQTVISFYYPAGLSYRRVIGIQVNSTLEL